MTLREYKQIMYQLNREKRLRQMKDYYQRNRQRLIEYQRAYRAEKRSKDAAT